MTLFPEKRYGNSYAVSLFVTKRLWKHRYANGNSEREEELTENEAYDIKKTVWQAISDVENAVKVRIGEEGYDALQDDV